MSNTQLSKNQQIKNGMIYVMPVGLNILIPIITIPIFTRVFSPADYGALGLSMIYAIFISGVANFGLNLAFERNYFEYRENKIKLSQLLYSSLTFVLILFTIMATITYMFIDTIAEFLTGDVIHANLVLASLFGHFMYSTISNYYYIYFKNTEKANLYTKYRILSTILNLTISLVIILYFESGIVGIVIAQFISGMIVFVAMFSSVQKLLSVSLNKDILIESLKISYPLFPRIFMGVLNTQIDKYLIGIYSNIAGVGVFHVGKKISESVFSFMTGLENVYNPQVYQRMFGQHNNDRDSVGPYLTPFLYISIFIALATATLSEEILTILTPSSYHSAIPIVIILSMYYGLLFFSKIVAIQLIYSRKTYVVSILTIMRIVINIIVNIPFIIKYGALGAALGTFIAGIISGVISLWVAQYYHRIYYQWRRISVIMLTFITSSFLIFILYNSDYPYIWAVVVKIIALIMYTIIGISYGIISRDNIQAIASIFNNNPKPQTIK